MPRPTRSPYDDNKPWLDSSRAEAMSAGFLHQATVTLDNDQIKALPTTGVEIVVAPGADRIIRFLSASATLNTVAGIYATDGAGCSWQFCYAELVEEASGMVLCNYGLEHARVSYYEFPAFWFAGAGDFVGYLVSASQTTLAGKINKSLKIQDLYNGVSDYTLGNAANTLQVSVAYLILNTTTGEFE